MWKVNKTSHNCVKQRYCHKFRIFWKYSEHLKVNVWQYSFFNSRYFSPWDHLLERIYIYIGLQDVFYLQDSDDGSELLCFILILILNRRTKTVWAKLICWWLNKLLSLNNGHCLPCNSKDNEALTARNLFHVGLKTTFQYWPLENRWDWGKTLVS